MKEIVHQTDVVYPKHKILGVESEKQSAAARPVYAEPQTEAEMALAQMWKQVDGFSGGSARVRNVFNMELSLIAGLRGSN